MNPLLERILVLALIAAGAFALYEQFGTASHGSNVTTYQDQMSSFQTATTQHYKRRPGRYAFGTLTPAVIIANSLNPSGTTNGTAVTNPWNGIYSEVGSDVVGANANVYGVWADNIPVSDCVTILESTGTGGGLTNGPFYGYSVAAAAGTTGAISTTLPDTDANAGSACKAPGTATVAILLAMNG